ncbi:unnamed protein product [Rotaria sordida]|uniref:Uncharacterized protein n=1 Tax=Rotaria sordida TaxID=392033 RepID=A0A819QDG6_9BILA|nr:unnamed protein product [Rotaria sordida]CAF4024331.1 unnamed protein product [Rotaria sordida]
MLDKHLHNDQRELDALNEVEAIRAAETERIATELQIKVDTLTNNVTNLETNDIKTKESLGSIKHNLLEIDENYVKDKDKLVQEKTNISNQHEQASVRSYK